MNFDLGWVEGNRALIGRLLLEHLALAILPILAALVICLPLGYLLSRTARGSQVLLAVLGVVSAIPALALIVLMPLLLGTRLANPITVGAALAIGSGVIVLRSVLVGLRSVPPLVTRSAAALGYGSLGRLVTVELPLAMPAILAGLRTAIVTNIALASLAVLVGGGGLGELFSRGLDNRLVTPILVGLLLSLALAVLAEGVILLAQRRGLPWIRGSRAA